MGFRELMKDREDGGVGGARGRVCWTEWRQDYGGNISLSINVSTFVSSVSHFIRENGTPGYTETKILLFKIGSRSRVCWKLSVIIVGKKKNTPSKSNI